MTTQPAALSRQPAFEMAYQERQSRLTTFFRLILVIPPAILLGLWGFAVFFTVIISWFALLFTGRYPQSLYDFHAGFERYSAYVAGYALLATDRWPGFSGSEDVGYPVQLHLGPPLPVYNRLKVLFRLILMIPVYLIAYAMGIVAEIGAIIAWFVIVVTGRLPYGLYQMLHLGLSYVHRAGPYYLLMTEEWPAFTQAADARALVPREPAGTLEAPEAPSRPADASTDTGDSFAPPRPPEPPAGS
ncbi:MAG TPA: DUF4389 domain-containing protein [Solirubrobacteraceae bacterium]|nr:DUF4389 domain-containing protein [Solirubrobacteraceae bacterium]